MAFNAGLDQVLSDVVDTVIGLDLFAYVASIVTPAGSTDSYGGTAPSSPQTTASNLPCKFKELRHPMTRIVGDKSTILATHVLTFRADQYTEVIAPTQEIHLGALNNEAARVFVRPFRLKGSFHHLVKVAAVLKSQ